jgi:hypothetical protein
MAVIGTPVPEREFMSITTALGTNSAELLYERAECFEVASDTIASAWPDIAPFVEKWVEEVLHGEMRAEDVYDLIARGLMYALVIHTDWDIHIVALTEFVQYPRKKTLRPVGFAGKNPILTLKFMPAVEEWARANGAEELEAFASRRAFKLMTRMGLQERHVHMVKPLFPQH